MTQNPRKFLKNLRIRLTQKPLTREVSKVIILVPFFIYIFRVIKFIVELLLILFQIRTPAYILHPVFNSRLSHFTWVWVVLIAYYFLGPSKYRRTKIIAFWLLAMLILSIISTLTNNLVSVRKCPPSNSRIYFYQSKFYNIQNNYYIDSKIPGILSDTNNLKFGTDEEFWENRSSYDRCFVRDGNGYLNYYLRKEAEKQDTQ